MTPVGPTVADLLEAAAARHPEAVAVVASGRSLTYAELDARASRLARRLQACGVGPDVLVGVCLGRSLDLAVAVQAVLRAGGACVPLDPAYPAERLHFMVGDTGVAVVVTADALTGRLPTGVPKLGVDADGPATAPVRATRPEHVGYVIYTSGSTGVPKGVVLTHRGLVNHHVATMELYGVGPGDRVLQFCSLGFDASIEEMLPTWAAGATVVFRPDDAPLLGPGWLRWLRDERITVVNLPTAYWQAWAADLEALDEPVPEDIRLVVVGGEKARGSVLRRWGRRSGGRSRWVNAYGPTETTCMSTYWESGGTLDDADPPIGRPLSNTTVVVVDEALEEVAHGVTGELLIGGAGVARGYLNAPARTAERFVRRPTGERVYRTGDLVRVLPSGDLDFAGRIDDQVKVRGFRIEPGEVEAALIGHPEVSAAAVVAHDDQLAAYVVGTTAAAELRPFLAGRLPSHMVPSTYTVLDALPLTENAKVDRAALPEPARPASPVPSRSPAEERMAAIWAPVLGIDASTIAPGDDFFDLGGHSLVATQVMAQVREEFGTETALRTIFELPTLGGLTSAVVAEGTAAPAAPPLARTLRPPGSRIPLSLAQEQMWALERAADPPGLYNITALHRFDGPVDVDALRRALAAVVGRQETLRTGFGVDGDAPYQSVVDAGEVEVDVAVVEGTIAEHDAAPFDLARPPLFRAGLFPEPHGSTRLALTIDHLICDGTGAAILVSELLDALAGRAADLPPLPVQFADFAVWQRASVTSDVLDRQLAWWLDTLAGMPLGPVLPFDHLPATPTRRIQATTVDVPPAVRGGLDDVARSTGSTLFTVAVAAMAALVGQYGDTTDVVFSTTLNGRNRAELQDLIGMFSGIGRLRTDLSGDPAFTDVVVRARDRVLGMSENQDVPFLRVRRALLPDFPTGGIELSAALPVELQFFCVKDEQELFFRGQLHPLSVTLVDDGSTLTGRLSYKLDFYESATIERLAGDLPRLLAAVAADPSLRFSELPVTR